MPGMMGGDDDGMGPGAPIIVHLTDDERAQLQQLEDLGVDAQTALYYYTSCGKDINMAASMILQDLDDPPADQDAEVEQNNGA